MTVRHWTEDELIAHIYGVGPEDGHLRHCLKCAERLQAMQTAQSVHHSVTSPSIGSDFLAAQRRKIYERLSVPGRRLLIRRFAPPVAASLVLGAGLLLFDRHHSSVEYAVKATDTQLVEEVGDLATNPEPAPVEPLRALFDE
jgi:hypothetical protein